jgi:DNA processing protein
VADSLVPESDLADALCLNMVTGIGPRMTCGLLQHFGSPAAILDAAVDELLQVSGIGPKLASAIGKARNSINPWEEIARCREMGITLCRLGSSEYPEVLAEIPDAPQILYCHGELLERDELAVAFVGSRRCTVYGRQQTERLAGTLARAGVTIISGLARGIDAVAHQAALTVGGRTIAVAATGLATVYPPEHADLAKQVCRQGAIVTESKLDQKPAAGLFPQRNRLISGLSLGVVVVEATRNSGALYTARHAMEQGRDILAVPGRIDSLASEGCHDLLRDGATLVRHADDILESLGPLMTPIAESDDGEIHSARELTLNDQEREVLKLLSSEPKTIDEVLRDTSLDSSRVLATLTVLEMKRLVRRLPGGKLVRTTH